ncbi:probable calcium-binding protein CML36 [Phalaenopsis equestris]|uniref:probable calcium-binding protein CML36 n=1 Tax=Phalaenopsis equestris TaxID=78828 RepID=UPI0009E3B9E9|nr:probable calcium-binding protein CML36 [Phalaenopsis equestris]
MRIVSCPPSFLFGSSKKKSRGDASPSLGSNSASSPSDDHHHIATPKSVLSPKPRRRAMPREEQSSSSSFSYEAENTKVTRRELEIVLRRLQPKPPTEEEVAEMLAEADRRGDGQFSVEEIAALGLETGGPASPDLRQTFAVFDGDGDGKISAEELRGVFATLGDEVCTLENCRRMIGVVDTDGDGFVCFDEFVRMMRGQS